jgi:hypothetical protein
VLMLQLLHMLLKPPVLKLDRLELSKMSPLRSLNFDGSETVALVPPASHFLLHYFEAGP